MRIATLQFAPSLGQVQDNIKRANDILDSSRPTHLDLLVLPELAFAGYNFANSEAIAPYLEPNTAPPAQPRLASLGPSVRWAIDTAERLGCHVTVGYPETTTASEGSRRNYNSSVTVNPAGRVVANYRKSFLYYTDETWADEGTASSEQQRGAFLCTQLPNLCNAPVGFGICMDMNPYRFMAPWTDYEFATAMVEDGARLVVMSMAWLTRLLPEELREKGDEPDMETLVYWLERFHPLARAAPVEPVVVVLCNRCGTETNKIGGSIEVENGVTEVEGSRVCYAGSSCVIRFHGAKVEILDRLGKSEERLLQVDTTEPAKYMLRHS
ncbi:N-terminal asparagine amidohydrolase-like protein [Polychaeton citri CBS 116435]|uniref:N-terminal asparagine amidohydrolase-like protein n=1 Tax=Polychaeton citri CBS 116435 TaxID=1314669 RepID=A0A9P4Q2V2_9PEZI|nr:N-terminal asparagine amidohydrolase-like protein [Polychaeton citri CBS 116435]